MNGRNAFGLAFMMILLLLAAGSGLAQSPRPATLALRASANNIQAAKAKWFYFDVDTPGDTGQYVSAAVNPANSNVYISYYDATNKSLRSASNGEFTYGCDLEEDWRCWTVDSVGDIGKYSSIAIHPLNGKIGIAYHDATNGKLLYLDPSPAYGYSWVTIDAGIIPVSWTGRHTSLKYGSDGTPNIAYQFFNPSGVEALMLASYVGSGGNGNCGRGPAAGKWQCDTVMAVEGVGEYASLAIDSQGILYIASYFRGPGELWLAKKGTHISANCGPGHQSWTCRRITGLATDAGQHASMYMDQDDNFHIAYYNATTNTLEYAVSGTSAGNCFDGKARCIEIDDMMSDARPHGISIAEDGAGYPIIAYQSKFGSLRVARPAAALGLSGGGGNCGPENPFSSWYCQTIHRAPYSLPGPVPPRHGEYISIAVGPSGLATIAYTGFKTADNGNLMVAWQRFQTFMPRIGSS